MRLFLFVTGECEPNVPFEKREEPENPALSLQDYMMATEDFQAVTFVATYGDSFYFQVGEERGLETDRFEKSDKCCQFWIKSIDNKCLLLCDDGQIQAQTLNIKQQKEPGCKFNIQFYNNSEEQTRRAIMLYSQKDGKKTVVSCSDENEVCAEEMQDLPSEIKENSNKAIFYRVRVESTTSKYMFESSLYASHFLGLDPDESNPSLKKLVLHHKGGDEVDESCQFQALPT